MTTTDGDRGLPADVARAAEILRRVCGNDLVAILFFGSRLVNTSPGKHSAADLFVIVDDYAPSYRALHRAGHLRRSQHLLAFTNRLLPPNVLRLFAEEDAPGCKCFFISRSDLARELGPRSRDHFCKGRLTQTVRIIAVRDESTRHLLEDLLEGARRDSLRWVPAYLPLRFRAADYCARMLEISYRSEIRPESRDRVLEVLEAQGDELVREYERILQEHGPSVGLRPESEGSFFHHAASAVGFRRRDAYFGWSRLRATLRWLKYVITFENWLDYIAQKLHRRSGVRLELTEAQRRYPFLLLWPKLFRVLWQLRCNHTNPSPHHRGSRG